MSELKIDIPDNELNQMSEDELDEFIEQQWIEQQANDEIKLEIEMKTGRKL